MFKRYRNRQYHCCKLWFVPLIPFWSVLSFTTTVGWAGYLPNGMRWDNLSLSIYSHGIVGFGWDWTLLESQGGSLPYAPVVTTATAVKILTVNFSQFDR